MENKKNIKCVEPDLYDLIRDLYKFIGAFDVFKEAYDKDKEKNKNNLNEAVEHLSQEIENIRKEIPNEIDTHLSTAKPSKINFHLLKDKAQLIAFIFSIIMTLVKLIDWFFKQIGIKSPLGGVLEVFISVLEFILEFLNVYISA